jgi:hypothetical protein
MEKDSVRKIRKFLNNNGIDEDIVAQLIVVDNAAIKAREALDKPSREKLEHTGRLLGSLLREILKANREALGILEQIDQTKDRILNPGSHAGNPDLYSAEVASALALIRRLSALADERKDNNNSF